MKPLSVLAFIKGSFRKMLPLAITVTLAVALLYFLSMCFSHLINENIELNVVPLSNMSLISGTGEQISPQQLKSDMNKLQESNEIKGWYVTYVQKVNLRTITSDNSMFLLMMKNENIPSVMKAQKLRLVEGRMPQSPWEVVIHKKLAVNHSLKVGSVVAKHTDGWNIDEDVKVVGIIDGPAVLGLGGIDEKVLMSGKVNTTIVTVAEDRSVASMNQFLKKNFEGRYMLLTIEKVKSKINENNRNINVIMIFIGTTVVLVLSFLLGNISMIQYTQRSKEFELLNAIGYTKKYIALKVFKEIVFSTLLGYILGIIAAVTAGWLMNVCLLNDKDLGMQLIMVKNVFVVMLVPALVSLSAMIAPMKLLKFNNGV